MAKIRFILFCATFFWLASYLTSCKAGFSEPADGVDTDNSSEDDREFFGPGTAWKVILNSETESFKLERRSALGEDADLTIEGDYVLYDSGFSKLDTNEIDGNDITQVKSALTALEIGGQYVLLLPIEDDNDQIIASVAADTCLSNDFSGNWISYKVVADVDLTSDTSVYGTYTYYSEDGTGALTSRYNFSTDEGNTNTKKIGGDICEDGISEGTNTVHYTGSDQAALIQFIPDEDVDEADITNLLELLFVMDTKDVDVFSQLDSDDYIGFLYDSTLTQGNRSVPIAMTCESELCEVFEVTDISNKTLSSEALYNISLEVSESQVSGFVSGEITAIEEETDEVTGNDEKIGKIICSIDVDFIDTEKIVWACIGQAPFENTQLFNLFVTTH